jgi:hypothetical protein
MSVREVIEHFQRRTDLPIAIDEVQRLILSKTDIGRLRIIHVDMDSAVGQGVFKLYPVRPSPYSEILTCCDISIPNDLHEYEKRLVMCKELIHLLDPPNLRINTREQISELVSRIILDPSLMPPEEIKIESKPVIWDRLSTLVPGAVLFPICARSIILEHYKSNRLSLERIADGVQLPRRLVQIVLSDAWPSLHQQLKELFD